jgi:hypothetical protein
VWGFEDYTVKSEVLEAEREERGKEEIKMAKAEKENTWRVEEEKRKGTFRCYNCSRNFTFKSSLTRHNRNFHPWKKDFYFR